MSDRKPGTRTTISRSEALRMIDTARQDWRPPIETPPVETGLNAAFTPGPGMKEAVRRVSDSGDAASLLVFEVDQFQEIKAAVGQAGGERILDEVEACLAREVRDADVAGRLSGDAFALLLHAANRRTALAVAERIRESVASAFTADDRKTPVTVSVGVAAMPVDTHDGMDVFTMAYYGLDRARRSGGNRVQLAADAMPLA